jgi:uncharacterized protein (TIGR02172 family)
MEITSERTGQRLTLTLAGRLDVASAPALEAALQLEGIRDLVMDLEACVYISSVGLRSLLRGLKDTAKVNGTMVLVGVQPSVMSILELTGLTKLLTVKPKAREVSIDGLEFISAGMCGQCFRLDHETILKLYNEGVEPRIAEQEKEFAKAAFVMGIPTAISYDVVACGNRTGVVYEMLDAEPFSKVIRNDPQGVDAHARTLADVARMIHSTTGDPALFPNIKHTLRGSIRQMDFFLSAQEIDVLLGKLESIPDADNCVHFDLHTSNIMMREGEPVLIDMGDMSIGSYLFDVGLLCCIYGLPELGSSELVTKIPTETGFALWQGFVKHYFADKPPEEFEFFQRNMHFLASLRLIQTITSMPTVRDLLATLIKDKLLAKMLA